MGMIEYLKQNWTDGAASDRFDFLKWLIRKMGKANVLKAVDLAQAEIDAENGGKNGLHT